jgi:hypothetical protein
VAAADGAAALARDQYRDMERELQSTRENLQAILDSLPAQELPLD